MKRLIAFAVVLVAFTTLALTPDYVDPLIEAEFMQGWQYGSPSNDEYELLIFAQRQRIQVLEAALIQTQEQLFVSEGIVTAVGRIESLQQQISDLTQARDNISAQLSTISAATASASTTLSQLRAASARINTMTAAFTPDMGIVGCRRFPGVSMEPTFDYNSLVCITDHPSYLATAGVGDIVIAPSCSASLHLIHRIVRVEDGAFRLKGDNRLSVEDACLVEKSEVFYKVVGIAKNIWW